MSTAIFVARWIILKTLISAGFAQNIVLLIEPFDFLPLPLGEGWGEGLCEQNWKNDPVGSVMDDVCKPLIRILTLPTNNLTFVR